MHTKRFKWMLGLAIFFGLGVIGNFMTDEGLSIGGLIVSILLAALFAFLAWRFKDERYSEPKDTIKGDPTKKLERLVQMHKQGVITDEEFAEKKDKLMKQI